MKIVIIIKQLGIGGAERLAVDEVNELFRRGVPVTLVTLKREGVNSYMQNCLLPEDNRVCINFRSLLDINSWSKLIIYLRSYRPDLVITHLWFSNTIGRIAAFLAGAPHVFSFEHNVYIQVKTRKQFFIDWLLQTFSTRIIAVSEAVRDSLVELRIHPRRIIVIENGIDLARYREAETSNIRAEKNLGSSFIFLFVGRLIEQKGVDILLNAFKAINNATLLLAGDGTERSVLEQKAHDLGITSNVFFLGVRDDIPELMKAADCLVLPSRWEGQGLVVPEAFAAGLPVIISDFPAGVSLVHNGGNGLVVQRENATQLAQAMETMQFNSELRFKYAENGARDATRFSIVRHIDTMLAYAN